MSAFLAPHLSVVLSVLVTLAPAAASARDIPVSDANVVGGLSPYIWVRTADGISSSVTGASVKVGFLGTRTVTLKVDTTRDAPLKPVRYPILAWTVNGGAPRSHQLAPGETAVVLSSHDPDPVIDLYIKGISPYEDRFHGEVPVNAVTITGFKVVPGGRTTPVSFPSKVWLTIGDSITAGDAAAYAAGQGRPPDDLWSASDEPRNSYAYLLARHFGYREARLAYGGYDWGGGMAGVPSLSTLIDQATSTVSRLKNGKLSPVPEVVLINLGENGDPTAGAVTEALTKLRSRVSKTTKIIVLIPPSGRARAAVTNPFHAYKAASGDQNVYLVDLGQLTFATADGQHPVASGHQAIYRAALPFFDAILGVRPGATP